MIIEIKFQYHFEKIAKILEESNKILSRKKKKLKREVNNWLVDNNWWDKCLKKIKINELLQKIYKLFDYKKNFINFFEKFSVFPKCGKIWQKCYVYKKFF